LDSAAFAGVAGVETMWYDQELTIVVNEKCVMLLWGTYLRHYMHMRCVLRVEEWTATALILETHLNNHLNNHLRARTKSKMSGRHDKGCIAVL
jgi:hypothetical protein